MSGGCGSNSLESKLKIKKVYTNMYTLFVYYSL